MIKMIQSGHKQEKEQNSFSFSRKNYYIYNNSLYTCFKPVLRGYNQQCASTEKKPLGSREIETKSIKINWQDQDIDWDKMT